MKLCSVAGCFKKHFGKGWCSMHYTRFRNHGDVNIVKLISRIGSCSVEGCSRPIASIGLCRMHSARYYTTGIIGEASPRKRPDGTGYINPDGYKVMYEDSKRIFEHVQLAEKALGRKLPAGAEVHHLNGDEADNRLDNLVICPDHAYHMLLHKRQKELG